MSIESHRKACFKYDHSEKGKKKKQEWRSKYKSDSDAKYYQNNKEKLKKQVAEYKKTMNGKLTVLRHMYKRHKQMNTKKMFNNPFNKSEIIDWHHIDNCYVVAIPRDLHRHFQGKFHRDNLMGIVKQIYLV